MLTLADIFLDIAFLLVNLLILKFPKNFDSEHIIEKLLEIFD